MSVTKKLVNNASSAVDEAIDGLIMTAPNLIRLQGYRVIIRKDVERVVKDGRVAILSGGGSGHEPAMGGYVGHGMLTAAVAGDVFASPSIGSILAAVREIGRGNCGGVLMIVMNYTGDRVNFRRARDQARIEGIRVEMVVVGEDCALAVNSEKRGGRRGLCGTILIHKIAGAMAEQGHSLEEIAEAAATAASEMGTMSVSLSACSVPGKGPSFVLGEDEMELGLGIHGEAGIRRERIQRADEVVATMLDHLTSSKSYLSLNADYSTDVPAWSGLNGFTNLETGQSLVPTRVPQEQPASKDISQPFDINDKLANTVRKVLEAISHALIDAEDHLNELDRGSGDGDCGSTLKRGSEAILSKLSSGSIPCGVPPDCLSTLAKIVETSMGGSSGGLYGSMLTAAAAHFTKGASLETLVDAFKMGVDAIMEDGDSQPGDRTMLDALVPAHDTLRTQILAKSSLQHAVSDAAKAAHAGAQATVKMPARAGRAMNVNASQLMQPDPGAEAVAIWMSAAASALT